MKIKTMKKTKGILMLELLILIVCFVFPIAIAVSALSCAIVYKYGKVTKTIENLRVPIQICRSCRGGPGEKGGVYNGTETGSIILFGPSGTTYKGAYSGNASGTWSF